MKKTYLLAAEIFFFIFFYSHCIFAEDIVYMVATPEHVPALLAFYSDITDDDAAKIVIYPEEVRENILRQSIITEDGQSRYFIAVDTTTDSIVSVAKVFLITNSEELSQILTYEIRSTHPEARLLKKVRYEIPYKKVFDFTESLDSSECSPHCITRAYSSLGSFVSLDPSPTSPVGRLSPRTPRRSPTSPSSEDYNIFRPLYIYMGGFCTKPGPKYRGRGINTKLQQFALSHLLPQVAYYIDKNYLFSICCVFGQVRANESSRATTRVFAKYVNEEVRPRILPDPLASATPVITLTLNRYLAFKPAFYLTPDKKLEVYPDDHHLTQEGKGVGNVLCYEIFSQWKSITRRISLPVRLG